jgi:hypothetical protein
LFAIRKFSQIGDDNLTDEFANRKQAIAESWCDILSSEDTDSVCSASSTSDACSAKVGKVKPCKWNNQKGRCLPKSLLKVFGKAKEIQEKEKVYNWCSNLSSPRQLDEDIQVVV